MKIINALTISAASLLLLCTSCHSNWDVNSRLSFKVLRTKGSAITTGTFNTSGKSFVVNAYLEADGRGAKVETQYDQNHPRYIVDKVFSRGGTSWTADGCTWRYDVYTNFWCYSPETLANGTRTLIHCCHKDSTCTDSAQKTMSFTYEMPSVTADSTDALILEDMVFAYARQKYNEEPGSSSTVNLEFSHPVSAIRFKAGTIATGNDIGCVMIAGFHTSGTCTLTGNISDNSISYVWSSLDGASSNTGYRQKINLTQLQGGDMETGDKVFMVIPQTLTDDVTVTVDFVESGTLTRKTASLGGSAVTWLPGKYYTYKLNYSGSGELIAELVDEYNLVNGNWD